MRDLTELRPYRVDTDPLPYNAFTFYRKGNFIRVIASSSDGWDHVSVSLEYRTPTWDEMEFVKRNFFFPHETVMQLHVPENQHISYHPYCLHLWRPLHHKIPLPPLYLV